MGLYTGVYAIKKIDGFDNNTIQSARYYDRYKNDVITYEKYGGYPKLHIMLNVLGSDLDMEDTQDNYDKIHKEYTIHMKPRIKLVETVDANIELQNIDYLELAFFKRYYELANYLRDKLQQDGQYFKLAIEPTVLMEVFYEYYEQIKDLGIEHRFFSKEFLDRLEHDLNKYKDTHFFEVFVS